MTKGPYGFVRHPFYAAMLVLLPSAALTLWSWFGVAATVLLAGVLVLRTALEDRELQRRLDGYADYAQRVRYRLVSVGVVKRQNSRSRAVQMAIPVKA